MPAAPRRDREAAAGSRAGVERAAERLGPRRACRRCRCPHRRDRRRRRPVGRPRRRSVAGRSATRTAGLRRRRRAAARWSATPARSGTPPRRPPAARPAAAGSVDRRARSPPSRIRSSSAGRSARPGAGPAGGAVGRRRASAPARRAARPAPPGWWPGSPPALARARAGSRSSTCSATPACIAITARPCPTPSCTLLGHPQPLLGDRAPGVSPRGLVGRAPRRGRATAPPRPRPRPRHRRASDQQAAASRPRARPAEPPATQHDQEPTQPGQRRRSGSVAARPPRRRTAPVNRIGPYRLARAARYAADRDAAAGARPPAGAPPQQQAERGQPRPARSASGPRRPWFAAAAPVPAHDEQRQPPAAGPPAAPTPVQAPSTRSTIGARRRRRRPCPAAAGLRRSAYAGAAPRGGRPRDGRHGRAMVAMTDDDREHPTAHQDATATARRRRRGQPDRPPRRGVRLPRPQRRRQDDHAADAARPGPADLRHGDRARPAAGRPGGDGRIGALVEGPGFYPYLSGRDNLRVLARYRGLPTTGRSTRALDRVDLAERGGDRFSRTRSA